MQTFQVHYHLMLVMCQGKAGAHTLLMEMETVAACWKAVWQYPFPAVPFLGICCEKKKEKTNILYCLYSSIVCSGVGKKRKIK